MERTLVLLKPDAVQRGLSGQVIGRFESKGLKIVGMKMIHMDRALAGRHYGVHEGKPFFEGLVNFITSSPIVAIALEGPKAVEVVRAIVGVTDPKKAAPGTIRGDFGMDIGRKSGTRVGLPGERGDGVGVVLRGGGANQLRAERGTLDFGVAGSYWIRTMVLPCSQRLSS